MILMLAVQKKPEGKNPADSNGQGEPVNEPENPDQGTPGDETAAPDGQKQTMMKARIMSQMMVILRIHK